MCLELSNQGNVETSSKFGTKENFWKNATQTKKKTNTIHQSINGKNQTDSIKVSRKRNMKECRFCCHRLGRFRLGRCRLFGRYRLSDDAATRTFPAESMPLRTMAPLRDGTASRTMPAGTMRPRTMAPLRDGTASRTMPAGTMRPRTMAPRVPSPRAGAPVPALLLASRTQRPAVITSDAWHRIETSFDLTLLFSFLSKTGRHNDVTQRLRGLFTYSVPGTTTLLCHGANLNPGPNLPDELTSSAI